MTNIMNATSTQLAVLYLGAPTGTTAATVYTVPASKAVKVASASLTNSTASAAVVSVYLNGLTDSPNGIVLDYTVAAKDTVSLTDVLAGLHLDESNTIGFKTSVSGAVNFVITGAVLSV